MAKYATLTKKQRILRDYWIGILSAQATGKENVASKLETWSTNNNYSWDYLKDACTTIFNFILNRPTGDVRYFSELDAALNKMDDKKMLYKSEADGNIRTIKVGPASCATFVADFLVENGLLLRDANLTTFEMDEITNNTLSGNTFYKFGAFVSQYVASNKTSNKNSTNAPATSANSNGPANPYKSIGPLSKNVTTLVSGTKEMLYDLGYKYIFCINADKTGANVPSAFVTPVTLAGVGRNATAAKFVSFGSGQGYNNCKLYFIDYAVAEQFLPAVKQRYDGEFTNIAIAKAKTKSDEGFYEVETEFGNAWIKARNLNEALLEADKKSETQNEGYCEWCGKKNPEGIADTIKDFDTYEESFMHEYN